MNKDLLFHLYWGVCLIVHPLFLRVGEVAIDPRVSKDQFFIFSIFLSLALFQIGKVNKYIIAIGSISIFHGFIFSDFTSLNANYQLISMMAGIMVLVQFNSRVKTEYLPIIYRCLIISGSIQLFLLVFNYFGMDLNRDFFIWLTDSVARNRSGGIADGVSMGTGSLINANVTGGYMAALSPIFMINPWAGLPIVAISLYLCASAMPVVAVILSIPGILALRVKKLRIPCLSIAAIFAVFVLIGATKEKSYFSSSGRIDAWSKTLNFTMHNKPIVKMENGKEVAKLKIYVPKWKAIQRIITGRGLGYYSDYFRFFHKHKNGTIFRQAHNEYIEIFVAFGIFGLSVLLIFLWKIRHYLYKGDLTLVWIFIISLINSVGHFFYHISPTALIGLLALGALLRESNEQMDTEAIN